MGAADLDRMADGTADIEEAMGSSMRIFGMGAPRFSDWSTTSSRYVMTVSRRWSRVIGGAFLISCSADDRTGAGADTGVGADTGDGLLGVVGAAVPPGVADAVLWPGVVARASFSCGGVIP